MAKLLKILNKLHVIANTNLTAILCGLAVTVASITGSFSAYSLVSLDNDEPKTKAYTIKPVCSINSELKESEIGTRNEGLFPLLNEGSIYDSLNETVNTEKKNSTSKDTLISKLYSRYAVVMDGDNQRVLVGKNEYTKAPNASTTKILTCILALEYGNKEAKCMTSKYAASMPDVQLNASSGEIFELNDLVYSLMLRSHNDTAVIIAENVVLNYIYMVSNGSITDNYHILDNKDLSFFDTSKEFNTDLLCTISTEQSKELVGIFSELMNMKAAELGCVATHFITPNGLDAVNEDGIHATTPTDLAIIMSYCIKNKDFLKITEASSHSFNSYKKTSNGELIKRGSYSVTNTNAFLSMYDNIISGKTGFTGDAGYCYVCAYKCDKRTFIVVLLACGWPNNKTYKWHDSRLLLNYAREKYFEKEIVTPTLKLKDVSVKNGLKDSIKVHFNESCSMLLSDTDVINVVVSVPETIEAPIKKDSCIGDINIYINDNIVRKIPVYASNTVKKKNYFHFLTEAFKMYAFSYE